MVNAQFLGDRYWEIKMVTNFIKASAGAAIATILTAGIASAATVTERFDFYWDYSSNGSWVSLISNTEGDLTMDLTATTATDGQELTGDEALVQHWNGYGVGVNSGHDREHTVDSTGANDVALFSFSIDGVAQDVTVESIAFNYVDRFDAFDLYVDGAYVSSQSADDGPYGGTQYSLIDLDAGPGSVFGIGASSSENCYMRWSHYQYKMVESCRVTNSSFKIKYLTVTYDDEPSQVPLPAGMVLLLTGLGGLGLSRKRKS